MLIREKTVIVTGASSGIGRATAREFAKAGANVVLASRDKAALTRTAEQLSGPGRGLCLAVPTDMREPESVRAMVDRAVEELGGIDVLVNNAGVGLNATIAEGDLENMRDIVEVNLFGYIHAIQAVVPHIRKRGGGAIVNVSSVAGRIAAPYSGVYSMTKAAISALSDALRLELEDDGINVITAYPGFTDTGFHRNAIRELEMPRPSIVLRGVSAAKAGRRIVVAVREDEREFYVTLGDRMAVLVKNAAPRLVDWGVRRLWLGGGKPKRLRS